MNTDNLQTEHCVLKLINGEEVICKVQKNFIKHYKDFYDPNGSVTIYSPLKATVEQYYEKEDGNHVSVFERTIMTSCVRLSYIQTVELPYSMIILACEPSATIVEKYDDLLLKYDTYATNPELADDLYGTNNATTNFFNELDDDDLGEELEDDDDETEDYD